MNRAFNRLLVVIAIVFPMAISFVTAQAQAIKLKEPDKKRGLPFMETLSVKASAVEWSDRELSLQDLSDLLWAANGINRPAEKKSTASSAMNARDVDVYVFMKEGVYLYNTEKHELTPVLSGDFRSQIMMARGPRPGGPPPGDSARPRPPMRPQSNPPIQLVLISDTDRFRMGAPELKYEWGALDAGIVSQNISLFCAATGLKTRPRASMDKEKIKTLLKLKDSQKVFLNHPVGYAK
jgi:nitroreductase